MPADTSRRFDYVRQTSLAGFVLVCLFAISSWITINGVWVELPLLVQDLPEMWYLPSYIVIIIQIANIGPLFYGILNRFKCAKDNVAVFVILVIGATACILLAFLWQKTSWVGGAEHSVAFLALTFAMSLVDCTSSVVYLPYISVYKEQYITALYVGEGLSGFVPSIVGLIQGAGGEPSCVNKTVGGQLISDVNSTLFNTTTGPKFGVVQVDDPPRFSVLAFFVVLFVLMLVSLASFLALHYHPAAIKWRRLVETIGGDGDDKYITSDGKAARSKGANFEGECAECSDGQNSRKKKKVPTATLR